MALLFITGFKVSSWLLFTTHDVWEAALWPILPVHPLLSTKEEGAALTVHYLPYCASFPRLNQFLQGDWLLSWWASELQVEEEEACRVQVEAVLLGLRKKDMPLGVDFFGGSSDCCWDLSCWLMMIWMSSWGKVGRKRKWAGSLMSVSCLARTACKHCPYIIITQFISSPDNNNVSLLLWWPLLSPLIDVACISFDMNKYQSIYFFVFKG